MKRNDPCAIDQRQRKALRWLWKDLSKKKVNCAATFVVTFSPDHKTVVKYEMKTGKGKIAFNGMKGES